MNPEDPKHTQYGLVGDMLATADVIRRFDAGQTSQTASEIAGAGALLMTGEGSSRIFPARSAIAHSLRQGWPLRLHTEAGVQAAEYSLEDWAAFALSNSGRTAEVVKLYRSLKEKGCDRRYSLAAFDNTPLGELSTRAFVLSCGKEGAVAATKSVVEQALFYRALLEHAAGKPSLAERLDDLATKFRRALVQKIDPKITKAVADASCIYWAGRNDGVAEELTLKTNEITRKQSDFLEGTYAVHGVEEVMSERDVVLWIDPYEDAEEKFHKTLVEGVGLKIFAISARQTRFDTIVIPDAGDLGVFVQMAAGWNLLVETGLALGVDLDKPQRARKVGNEIAP